MVMILIRLQKSEYKGTEVSLKIKDKNEEHVFYNEREIRLIVESIESQMKLILK